LLAEEAGLAIGFHDQTLMRGDAVHARSRSRPSGSAPCE